NRGVGHQDGGQVLDVRGRAGPSGQVGVEVDRRGDDGVDHRARRVRREVGIGFQGRSRRRGGPPPLPRTPEISPCRLPWISVYFDVSGKFGSTADGHAATLPIPLPWVDVSSFFSRL